MSEFYIGIDAGKKGGIVAIRKSIIIYKCAMPMIGDVDVDFVKLGRILSKFKNRDAHMIWEKFGGFFGYSKKVACSLNFQCGGIEALVKSNGIAATRFMPTQWQKEMFVGVNVVFKPKKKGEKRKKDTKKMALIAAKRLFPNVDFRKNNRCTVAHDGIVDAVLLAEFGRRKGL